MNTNTINTEVLIQFLLQQQTTEKTIDIDTAYNLFMNHLNINNRPGTTAAYQRCLKPIFKYLKDHKIFKSNQITNDVINEYILHRKPFVKNETINKEVSGIRTMLNLMIKNKYIDNVNFEFTKLKTEKPVIPQIKKDDLNKIISYMNTSKITDKNKLIFFLMLTTGVRTNELLHIKNKNINIEEMTIYLDFTKTGHPRYIYIIPSIKDLLLKVMNNNEYLFTDENNIQMTSNGIKMFFKHLRDDIKIDVLSPHKLRHYYATNLYEKSLDIYLVSKLLGHTNIKTTQIYLDLNDKNNQTKNNYYNPMNDLIPIKN